MSDARGRVFLGIGAVALICALAACAGTPSTDAPAGGGEAAAPRPVGSGQYKVGKPYKIKGIWYYPRVDYEYDETGIASWYGPGFHGEMTANGEIYDMNDMTAAHKTLPMPSVVRVTNLENGRTLKLRVNDRGPFVGERIIDVSRRAAQMLGFYGAGTARVRVQIEAEESQQIAAAMTRAPVAVGMASMPSTVYAPPAPAAEPPREVDPAPTLVALADEPSATMAGSGSDDGLPVIGAAAPAAPALSEAIAGEALPPPARAATRRPAEPVPTRGGGAAHFVQAGAFADPANVAKARSTLDTLGPVEVTPLTVDGRRLMRVRVGPLPSAAEAHQVLVATLRAGFLGSRLVVE